MQKTTIYLPEALHAQIKAASQREQRPQADVIRGVLQRHFDQEERPILRSIGIASDPGFSSENIEEWLAENWRPEEDWGHETPNSHDTERQI